MYIELQCAECGCSSRVSFAVLYETWKEGYAKMEEKYKPRAKTLARIKCHCGYGGLYEGLMFRYIFQLIFDEFIKEKTIM